MNKTISKLFQTTLILTMAGAVSCVDGRYNVDQMDFTAQIAPEGIDIPLAVISRKTLGEALGTKAPIIKPDSEGYYAAHAGDNEGFTVNGAALKAAFAAGAASTSSGVSIPIDKVVDTDFSEVFKLLKDIAENIKNCDMVPPVITLGLTNPTKVTLSLDLQLNSKVEGGETLSTSVTLPGIAPDRTTWFFIAAPGVTPPADGRNYTAVTTPETFLNLMKTIPNSIDSHLSVTALSGDASTIDEATEYLFGADYQLIFPLRFGHKMKLEADLDENGLNDVFSKLADSGVKMEQVTVTVKVDTSLQLKIDGLKASFTDKDNNSIEGLTVAVTGKIEGPAPLATPNERSSLLTITMTVPQGGDFAALKGIDRLNFTLPLTGTAVEGGKAIGFRPADYFEARAWVSLPKGVTVDLRNLK